MPPEIPEDLKPYVEELRQEAAGYRTKYAPFRDAFDGYKEDEVQFLLNLVDSLKAKDVTPAAKVLRDMAYDLLGEKWTEDAPWGEEPEPESQEDEEMPEGSLTAEEMQKMLDEREERQRQEREERELAEMVEQVKAEAKALGYEPDTPDYFLLINTAMHKTDHDLSAAAALLAPVTGIGGEPASEPDSDPEPAAPRFPKPATGGAGVTPGEEAPKPKNVTEARDAFHAWLDSNKEALAQ